VIVLDTHVWIWWVHADAKLPNRLREQMQDENDGALGISVISCWEIAKLVEHGRLILPTPVEEWIGRALTYPGTKLLELTPKIAIESTQLPAPFHRDPADQMIVATARIHNCPLATLDEKLLSYPHIRTLPLK